MSRPADPLPELGPLLGRLADPAPRGPAAFPLDDVRLALVTRLFELGAAARADLAAGDAAGGRRRLGREPWLAAWRAAARRAADRLLEDTAGGLAAAAAESRPPRRVLRRYVLDAEGQAVIRNRCEAAGIPLEEMAPPEDAPAWEDGLLHAAMALDASWERLEAVILEEHARCAAAVAAVRAWRRPLAPLWAITAGALAAFLLLGLSLGGYLPAPGPLATLQHWFWSLPWP